MDKSKDDFITATEINKFTYCNYAWYYEKVCKEEYFEKKRELNYKLKSNNSLKSNFKKGLEFHDGYYEKNKASKKAKYVLFILFFVMLYLLIVLWKFYLI